MEKLKVGDILFTNTRWSGIIKKSVVRLTNTLAILNDDTKVKNEPIASKTFDGGIEIRFISLADRDFYFPENESFNDKYELQVLHRQCRDLLYKFNPDKLKKEDAKKLIELLNSFNIKEN